MPPPINKELEQVIETIVSQNKVMALGLTVRQIQELANTQLGFVPSTSTFARVLRRLGVDTTNGGKHRWQWGK